VYHIVTAVIKCDRLPAQHPAWMVHGIGAEDMLLYG